MTKENNKEIEKKRTYKKKIVKKEEQKTNIKEEKQEEKNTNNIKVKYTIRDILLIMVLAIIFGFVLGSAITKKCAKKSVKELKEADEIYNDILENHYEELDKKEINSSVISGLIEGLNDKYAYYYNDKDGILNYNETINGYFIGLGIQIRANEDGKISVVSVYDDSPAAKAGIEENDIIVKMNEEEYNINNFYDLTYNIKSSKIGEKVNIEVLRNEESKKIEVELEKVEVESVSYTTREENGKNIGIITINNFANNTYDQFMKVYEEMTNQKVDSLVLDVRNNYEGTLENAAKIASLFLAKDSVIYQKGEEEIKSKDERVITIPAVVLINEATVSTGEMLASSLNENLNIPLVGTRTYGKGYMQKVIKLSNGRYVQHTTEEWKTSKGASVEEIGIKATHEISCEEEVCEKDVQLEKAIEIASNGVGRV